MKKAILNLIFLALVTFQYSVIDGDTLQSIAEKFCQYNDPRAVAEFREGIRQINYDVIGDGDVCKGMVLMINQFK
jgi:hypothetical protein